MNLLIETTVFLTKNGKHPQDVRFVTDGEKWTNWDNFCAAADFEYDEGFGGNEISLSLKVVGRDFWLERHEYDGAEWWEFKTLPSMPEQNEMPNIKYQNY